MGSDRPASIERAREIVTERTRGWVPIAEWGPKCAGCGADEYRVDGYCSCECRDYHDDEDVATLGETIDSLASALAEAERRLSEEQETIRTLTFRAVEVERQRDEARETQRELHRRAQTAESELATKPTLNTLTEALLSLKQCKSDRHRLRNDYAFKVKECARITRRAVAAEAALADTRRDLLAFGNHVPPCPRWITSGEAEDGNQHPCLCGFEAAVLAADPPKEDS